MDHADSFNLLSGSMSQAIGNFKICSIMHMIYDSF